MRAEVALLSSSPRTLKRSLTSVIVWLCCIEGQIDKVADVDDVTLEEMGFLMAGGKPTESDVSEIRKEVTTEA